MGKDDDELEALRGGPREWRLATAATGAVHRLRLIGALPHHLWTPREGVGGEGAKVKAEVHGAKGGGGGGDAQCSGLFAAEDPAELELFAAVERLVAQEAQMENAQIAANVRSPRSIERAVASVVGDVS